MEVQIAGGDEIMSQSVDQLRHVGGDPGFVDVSSEDAMRKRCLAPSRLRDESRTTEDASEGGQEGDIHRFLGVPQSGQGIGR